MIISKYTEFIVECWKQRLGYTQKPFAKTRVYDLKPPVQKYTRTVLSDQICGYIWAKIHSLFYYLTRGFAQCATFRLRYRSNVTSSTRRQRTPRGACNTTVLNLVRANFESAELNLSKRTTTLRFWPSIHFSNAVRTLYFNLSSTSSGSIHRDRPDCT